MIRNFNEVRLLGNVGRTPELRQTQKNNMPVKNVAA
jgi:single-stranded DNA-binding protein